MTYQAVWKNGREVRPGQRDCDGRYQAIRRELVARDMTGFTVLDVGAYTGYFSVRLAEDFGASVTAVDDFPGLPEGVRGVEGVKAVRERLSPVQVNWAQPGDYDVVLLLSVLHHVRWWPMMLDRFLKISKVMFVELAHPDEILPMAKAHRDTADQHAAVRAHGGRVIAGSPGFRPEYLRDLYVLDGRTQVVVS